LERRNKPSAEQVKPTAYVGGVLSLSIKRERSETVEARKRHTVINITGGFAASAFSKQQTPTTSSGFFVVKDHGSVHNTLWIARVSPMQSKNHPEPSVHQAGQKLLQPLSVLALALAIITLLFLTMTTPDRLGPGGVTVFFVVVYGLSMTITELIHSWQKQRGERLRGFWLRAYYAAIPVLILGLSSLRQLTFVDVIVIIMLTLVVSVYHKRRAAG